MMKMTNLPQRRQGGVALLEALLAAVLLAIGLLGTIGLQARAHSALTEAGLRAEATLAAERLVGVMTTDSANLGNYALARVACNATPAPTIPARLAQWHTFTCARIPGATIRVAVTAATAAEAPSQVVIEIGWQRQAGAPASTHSLSAFI